VDRRNFIRLTAAGSASVATVTIAGCGQQMLQGAIAAWKGPGEETDLRRWILG